MGGGGYVAGPAGLAATLTGTPLVLTEADSHLGLANRLLARRARRVCLAFPIAGREGERYLVTGRPVPAAVLDADRGRRPGAVRDRRRGALPARRRRQPGRALDQLRRARGLRRARRPRLPRPPPGRPARPRGAARAASTPPPTATRYTLLAYEPDLGDVLAAADLVLGRSGGSIFEVTAAGRPAILVPYPHATADHQSANAAWMERAGAATVLPDSALGGEAGAGRLRDEVAAILGDAGRLEAMAAASRSLAKPDAARRIADEVLAAAR